LFEALDVEADRGLAEPERDLRAEKTPMFDNGTKNRERRQIRIRNLHRPYINNSDVNSYTLLFFKNERGGMLSPAR
jgi:hypothetical protein